MTGVADDMFSAARALADAVLYEGYVLYPYRASSQKNQIRWQFGVLTPPSYSEADESERCSCRTECLARVEPSAVLHVRIRFLQVQARTVQARAGGPAGAEFETVDKLEVGSIVYRSWEEAVERTVDLPPMTLSAFPEAATEEVFCFDETSAAEPVLDPDGETTGRLLRRTEHLRGRVRTRISHLRSGVVRVCVEVQNLTDLERPCAKRAEAMRHSLVGLHTMLAVERGSFVSSIDPPADLAGSSRDCRNDGTYPVLIGAGDVVLSSPIILYDRPEVAPESPGDLYDLTEIDEILALRILTLTEEEKAEARGTDTRAAAVVGRCAEMPAEAWSRLHATMRSVPAPPEKEADRGDPVPDSVPWWDPAQDASVDPFSDSTVIEGVSVSKGDMVLLRPSHRADAQDLFLVGHTAQVEGVFKDVDGNDHVAVSVSDGPGTDEFAWQGRFLYFHPDELVPMRDETGSR